MQWSWTLFSSSQFVFVKMGLLKAVDNVLDVKFQNTNLEKMGLQVSLDLAETTIRNASFLV